VCPEHKLIIILQEKIMVVIRFSETSVLNYMSSSLCVVNRCFDGKCCFYLQGRRGNMLNAEAGGRFAFGYSHWCCSRRWDKGRDNATSPILRPV
jgi:hypothetical protein